MEYLEPILESCMKIQRMTALTLLELNTTSVNQGGTAEPSVPIWEEGSFILLFFRQCLKRKA